MSLFGIDAKRLRFLLASGVMPWELREFFDSSTKRLIQKGGKIRNAPASQDARIRTLIGLPPSAGDVVKSWFATLSLDELVSASELVHTFKEYESTDSKDIIDDHEKLARSVLVHLSSERPDEELMQFLQTEIPHGPRHASDVPSEEILSSPSPDESAAIDAIISAFSGGSIDEGGEGHLTFQLVKGLQHTALGEYELARVALRKLPNESAEYKALANHISSHAQKLPPKVPRGAVPILLSLLPRDHPIGRSRVLAVCTHDKPNATFVKPVALFAENGSIFALSLEDRDRLFPDSGSAIAFAGPGRPRQPVQRQYGIWDVDEHETDRPTKFHIEREVAEVHLVVSLKASSGDADGVRKAIREYFSIAQSVANGIVFELADGVLIGHASARSDLRREDAFDDPLRVWNSLGVLSVDDQRLVIGDLPNADARFDCSPLHAAARSLLRELRDNDQMRPTRSSLRAILSMLRADDDVLMRQRLLRVTDYLDRAESQDVVIDDMIAYICERPEFQARVDAALSAEVALGNEELKRLSSERARALAVIEQSSERIGDLERDLRSRTREVETTISRVFERAISDGIATLASARIFSALASRMPEVPAQDRVQQAPAFRASLLEGWVRSEALAYMESFGVGRRLGVALIGAARCLAAVGLSICVSGPLSELVAIGVARSIGATREVRIPIGATSEIDELKNLVQVGGTETVLISAANLSDIELYGMGVIQVLAVRARAGGEIPGKGVVFSLTTAAYGLPWPVHVRRIVPTFDLQYADDFDSSGPGELDELPVSVEDLAWLGFALRERLRGEVEKLPELEQALVTRLLARCAP